MKLLSTILSLSLIAAVLANPAGTRPLSRGRNQRPLGFIGPPTREQRLAEGWVDEDAKYFHEQDGKTNELRHYDRRFFKNLVPVEQRGIVLKNLVRSYLIFFASENIETWLAHGTLLGWFWNGKILPWDLDIDVQVSGETLEFLGHVWNNTEHYYQIPEEDAAILMNEREYEDEDMTVRGYLLDVNSQISERVRGDGMNVIDARWIDIHTGLYIDITGLSEVKPDLEPDVVRCKNNHKYARSDLYPMRVSTFEDVPAKIPYAYDKILIAEYQQKSLTLTEFEGHIWDPEERLWVKKSTLRKSTAKGNAKVA